MNNMKNVPKSLQNWFVIHFVIDIVVAIPLIFIPEIVMGYLGWRFVDPVAIRIVGAAFFAIGTESLLCRKCNPSVYIAMLNLKILWSSAAILGLIIAIYVGAPTISWFILFVFAVFLIVWLYYRNKLQKNGK